MKDLIIASVFENGQAIPKRYTCDGEDVNPPLTIEGIPEGTKSLVLIIDDPDAPVGIWDHWIVWNIPLTSAIAERTVPGKEAVNSWGRKNYGGPCPPSGTHRYFFKVFALDTELDLGVNANKADVEKAMKGHILAKGELIGVYGKK